MTNKNILNWKMELNNNNKKKLILDFIKYNPGIYRTELITTLEVNPKTVDRWLHVLLREKKISYCLDGQKRRYEVRK